MLRFFIAVALVFAVASNTALAGGNPPADEKRCEGKDQTIFSRFAGYFLFTCVEAQFDGFGYRTSDAKKKVTVVPVEGRKWVGHYRYLGPVPAPAKLQVQRNFINATRAAGGEVLFEDGYGDSTFRFRKDGKETWAEINFRGGGLNLIIVEVERMTQELKADADALRGGLAENGHVELVGLFFDTGKSELKPESDASLDEAKKLLDASPQLQLWVVGHTDSVGSVESNLALSQARAAAVVKALVEGRGVDAKRLAPFGAGPYAPVASNGTEEGRASNRRVELVMR